MSDAYVNWNAGVCRVIDQKFQRIICTSIHFTRAVRRARNLGYDVRVYCASGSKLYKSKESRR